MRQSTIRRLTTAAHRDFFGINDITSKDVAGAFSSGTKLPVEKRDKKYGPLMGSRIRLINEEKEKNVVFGRMRTDSDNVTTKHGQYEPDKTEKLYSTVELKQMFVPDNAVVEVDITRDDHTKQIDITSVSGMKLEYKISDVEPVAKIDEILQLFKRKGDDKISALKYKNKPPLLFDFEASNQSQCTSQDENISEQRHRHAPPTQPESIENSKDPGQRESESNEKKIPEIRRPQVDIDNQAGPEGARAPMHELHELSIEYAERQSELLESQTRFDRSIDKKFDVPVDESKRPVKAIEHIRMIRKQKIQPTATGLKQTLEKKDRVFPLQPSIKLDSHGFRNYSFQVPDWTKVRRKDVIGYLRSAIIYNNYDILAINKPYGIATHANGKKSEEHDMDTLVGEMAKSLNIERVFLAHRLDKTTSGILLFATSLERARTLNKMFKADDIKKTYVCITKGVPDPPHGIIDMPIGEIEVAGKLRSCPAPYNLEENKQLSKKYQEAKRAITEYSVIDSRRHVALVELKPQTGVKHQLRCHLSFGLKTPILGDHKYSYLDKIVPQKLPPSLLAALHLRQTKVRTLPMHLHAKSIVIPGAKANGETLFINAPLPQHFIDNLKSLKLSMPS